MCRSATITGHVSDKAWWLHALTNATNTPFILLIFVPRNWQSCHECYERACKSGRYCDIAADGAVYDAAASKIRCDGRAAHGTVRDEDAPPTGAPAHDGYRCRGEEGADQCRQRALRFLEPAGRLQLTDLCAVPWSPGARRQPEGHTGHAECIRLCQNRACAALSGSTRHWTPVSAAPSIKP